MPLDADDADLGVRDRKLLAERHARPLAPVGVLDDERPVALEAHAVGAPVAVDIAARLGDRRRRRGLRRHEQGQERDGRAPDIGVL